MVKSYFSKDHHQHEYGEDEGFLNIVELDAGHVDAVVFMTTISMTTISMTTVAMLIINPIHAIDATINMEHVDDVVIVM